MGADGPCEPITIPISSDLCLPSPSASPLWPSGMHGLLHPLARRQPPRGRSRGNGHHPRVIGLRLSRCARSLNEPHPPSASVLLSRPRDEPSHTSSFSKLCAGYGYALECVYKATLSVATHCLSPSSKLALASVATQVPSTPATRFLPYSSQSSAVP